MIEAYLIVGYRVKRWSTLKWSPVIAVEREVCSLKKQVKETMILNELKKEDDDILDVKLVTESCFPR